jgi:hypothetical protein
VRSTVPATSVDAEVRIGGRRKCMVHLAGEVIVFRRRDDASDPDVPAVPIR